MRRLTQDQSQGAPATGWCSGQSQGRRQNTVPGQLHRFGHGGVNTINSKHDETVRNQATVGAHMKRGEHGVLGSVHKEREGERQVWGVWEDYVQIHKPSRFIIG